MLLIASRAMLAPPYLVSFDEINFAYSVQDFNPVEHQPQPPGYPLFVGLLRLFALFIPQIENVSLAAALLGSAIALGSLWAVGKCFVGARTGLIAALLLLFHPSFWFASLTNPVRVFLAAGATAVALCLLKALSSRRASRWYCIAALALGIAGGFRPDLPFTLLPLMLYTGWKLRLGFRDTLSAAGLAILATSPWLAALIASVGGIRPLLAFFLAYGHQQGQSTSLLLGAAMSSAAHMAYTTTVWTCIGALSWVWCVAFRTRDPLFTNVQRQFLLVWFLSGFLFYAVVHTGDPDHTLSVIPVTCLIGAVLLERFAKQYAARALPAIVGGAVALNALLFFAPVNATASAASYQKLDSSSDYIEQVIQTLQAFHSKGPFTVVSTGFETAWRGVSYYFPDATVLTFETEDPQKPHGWEWHGGHRSKLRIDGESIMLPACGTVLWLDSFARPVAVNSGQPLSFMPGPVAAIEAKPGQSYTFRQFVFRTPAAACTERLRN